MLCVCVGDMLDVVFSGLYCEAWSYRCSCMGSASVSHADVVCLCLVFILWQFSMLLFAWLAVY